VLEGERRAAQIWRITRNRPAKRQSHRLLGASRQQRRCTAGLPEIDQPFRERAQAAAAGRDGRSGGTGAPAGQPRPGHIPASGYAAPPTVATFARAVALADEIGDTPFRFAAMYGDLAGRYLLSVEDPARAERFWP
jgi:hypothetical protein